ADAHLDPVSGTKTTQTPNLPGLRAGEDLPAAAPCRIDADGLVYLSSGAAADADAAVHGFTGKEYDEGEAVTLFGPGAVLWYAEGENELTPGQSLYLSANAGELADAASTGGTTAIAIALDV